MIEETINFALKFPGLLNPCRGCKKKCKSSKINFIDKKKIKYVEKNFQCFVENILTYFFYQFKSQKHVEDIFGHNINCKVCKTSCFRVIRTNSPIDILIEENGTNGTPIELKKFDNRYSHIGITSTIKHIKNDTLITFPGEHQSIAQHFTDLIKIIRFLSITTSSVGYLIHLSYNDRPNYLWNTINSFHEQGNLLILGEEKEDWVDVPIWGCLSFNIIKKFANSIEIRLSMPIFQDIDAIMINKYLQLRNRFFTFDDLLRFIGQNYDKQYNFQCSNYVISKSRSSNDYLNIDIFKIEKL